MCLQLPTSDIVNIKKKANSKYIYTTNEDENTYRVIVTKVYRNSIKMRKYLYEYCVIRIWTNKRDHKDKESSLAAAQPRMHYVSNQDINTNNSQQKIQHQK